MASAGDTGDGRETSLKVRRKPRQAELRRPMCIDRSGGLRNGPYFWNQRVEGYDGIYIVVGFGNFSEILNFRIYFLFKNNSRKILKSYLSHEKSQKLEKF
jgi:hypothetical protein